MLAGCAPAAKAPGSLKAPALLATSPDRENSAAAEPAPAEAGAPASEAASASTTLMLAEEGELQIAVRFDAAGCVPEPDEADANVEVIIIVGGQVWDQLHVPTDGTPAICSEHGRAVVMGDFNFDGNQDIAVPLDNSGQYAGPTYLILLYQPLNGHYQEASLLTQLTRDNLGMFKVDDKQQRLTTFGKSGCCIHYEEDYSVGGDYPESIGSLSESVVLEGDRCYVRVERSGTRGKGSLKRACRKDERP